MSGGVGGGEVRRVADYFVTAGLPRDRSQLKLLDEYSLEVNLKPSAYQDPITDITVRKKEQRRSLCLLPSIERAFCCFPQVIFPGLGENVPDYYQLLEMTPGGLSANLNHGSFRAPEVLVCYRRGRDRPPLVDVGVLYDGKERVLPDSQVRF